MSEPEMRGDVAHLSNLLREAQWYVPRGSSLWWSIENALPPYTDARADRSIGFHERTER